MSDLREARINAINVISESLLADRDRLEAEIERLQARVRELEAALGTARTALIHTRAFATLRSLQIQMDEALLHIDAVSAETGDKDG